MSRLKTILRPVGIGTTPVAGVELTVAGEGSIGIQRVSLPATVAITAQQARGTLLNNRGQAAEATYTLPAAAEGLNFIFQLATTGAGAVHLKAAAGDKIYLDGVALDDADKVTCAAPAAANTITFYAIEQADGTWDWIAMSGNGTWIDGGV